MNIRVPTPWKSSRLLDSLYPAFSASAVELFYERFMKPGRSFEYTIQLPCNMQIHLDVRNFNAVCEFRISSRHVNRESSNDYPHGEMNELNFGANSPTPLVRVRSQRQISFRRRLSRISLGMTVSIKCFCIIPMFNTTNWAAVKLRKGNFYRFPIGDLNLNSRSIQMNSDCDTSINQKSLQQNYRDPKLFLIEWVNCLWNWGSSITSIC